MHLVGGPKETQGGEFLYSLERNNAYEKRIMSTLNADWIFLFALDIDMKGRVMRLLCQVWERERCTNTYQVFKFSLSVHVKCKIKFFFQ